jgi:hypothetical protein
MDTAQKVAVVTGASRGIGAALVAAYRGLGFGFRRAPARRPRARRPRTSAPRFGPARTVVATSAAPRRPRRSP